jgi:S-formylglutathione hydrolase
MNFEMEKTRSHKHFDGYTDYYSHFSEQCNAKMNFTVYLPPQAQFRKLPVVYWLSGLTCNEETFMTEGGAQLHAKKYGIILIAPDTSPRNTGIEGEDDSYDLGSGAGFYLDATQNKWSKHYRMYSYVTQELRQIAEAKLPIDPQRSGICGHSMGGHGALVLGLRNPDLYRSISAFAPICIPSKSPWGIKAFSEYLGKDRNKWADYDASELIKKSSVRTPILIEQGQEDEYIHDQLFTDEFELTVKTLGYPVTFRRQAGYDHSYYFISTFIEEHLAFHAKLLNCY